MDGQASVYVSQRACLTSVFVFDVQKFHLKFILKNCFLLSFHFYILTTFIFVVHSFGLHL